MYSLLSLGYEHTEVVSAKEDGAGENTGVTGVIDDDLGRGNKENDGS